MNRTSLTLIVPLILLVAIGATPIMITEDVFASKYQRHTSGNLSQAASITNSCLNPVFKSNTKDNMISNGNCGGTVSQQGKSGQASTPATVQNANPNIELQRATTTIPIRSPPPSTNSGTLSLAVSWQCNPPQVCDGLQAEDFGFEFQWPFHGFGLQPGQVPMSGTANFTIPNTLEIELTNPQTSDVQQVGLTVDPPCTKLNAVTFDTPIPRPGESITCTVKITIQE
jgi:hypothetical protein